MGVRFGAGLEAILNADIDFLVDTISMQMYEDDVSWDSTMEFLDEVTGTKAGSPVTLTSKTTDEGQFFASVPTFNPPGSVIITVVILYKNTGSDATSRIIGAITGKADGTPMSIVTDGGDVNLHWTGPIFSIGG